MRHAMPDDHDGPPGRRLSRPWSVEDDETLRTMVAARRPTSAIASALGRTVDAVRGRAQTLRVPLTLRLRPWRNDPRRG